MAQTLFFLRFLFLDITKGKGQTHFYGWGISRSPDHLIKNNIKYCL